MELAGVNFSLMKELMEHMNYAMRLRLFLNHMQKYYFIVRQSNTSLLSLLFASNLKREIWKVNRNNLTFKAYVILCGSCCRMF